MHVVDSLQYALPCWIGVAIFFVLEADDDEVRVSLRHESLHCLVYRLQWYHRHHLFHCLISEVDGWNRLVVEEVLLVLPAELGVVSFVFVAV